MSDFISDQSFSILQDYENIKQILEETETGFSDLLKKTDEESSYIIEDPERAISQEKTLSSKSILNGDIDQEDLMRAITAMQTRK